MGADDTLGNKATGSAPAPPAFPRHEQTFPSLTPPEIARMRRFGEIRAYKDGEMLFEAGKPGPGPEGQATAADVPKFASGGVEMHLFETAEV
jgi:hypothetical protein